MMPEKPVGCSDSIVVVTFASMSLRRWFSFVLMFVLTAGSAEPVLGMMRDGEVHHESGIAAAEHSVSARGDHGHEDVGAPDHEHGAQHQHGTSADHCTHQHGTPLPARADFAFAPSISVHVETEPSVATDWTPTGLIQPPRA